mmetsp:Transcript_37653/g.33671  ORF Transcript_37653/g.33671 Transcript_37653/m.33671 type:complete len:254 (+) Transcript_37653:292-1053(+)
MKDILKEKAEIFEKEREEKLEDPMAAAIQSRRDILPEFSLDATKPDKIYNLFSIISREEWDLIDVDDMRKSIKKDKIFEKGKKFYTNYVIEEMNAIKDDRKSFKSDAVMSSKYKCLIYLNILLKCLKLRFIRKDAQQFAEELKVNPLIVKTILHRFFIMNEREGDKISYSRNSMLTDRLTCFIVVLALIYNDYEFEASSLLNEMKIEPKKFAKYTLQIGCSTKKKKVEGEERTFLKLEAPLDIKPMSLGKKKK